MERARSAVRFSLGKWTTAEEIEGAGDALRRIVERLNTRERAHMSLLRQLEFVFRSTSVAGIMVPAAISDRGYNSPGEFVL